MSHVTVSAPRLLGLSGSLRRQSYSTAILHGLRHAISDRAEIVLHPLDTIPPYNQDLDTAAPPEPVAALREAVRTAHGLIIATPEYNHGLPGMLKNALDWMSRPYGRSTMTGKFAFTITSSPGAIGGARAHVQLNETLNSIAVRVVLRPQAVITFVGDKIADDRITNAATLAFLIEGVGDLLRDIAAPNAADHEAA